MTPLSLAPDLRRTARGRFGWVAGQRPEYRLRPFGEVKEDLAQHWFRPDAATEENAWDYVQEAVEEGYKHGQQRARGGGM